MTDTIQAVSRSLSADVNTLNAISHNIANINTPGFRAERSVASFQSQLEGDSSTVSVDLKDGPVADTGRNLDLALRGTGFFEIQRGGETLLARAGNFRLDNAGALVNASGDQVLGDSGPLQLPNQQVRIDGKGEIWAGDRSLGSLKLVDVADPSHLLALDGGAFRYDGTLTEFKGKVQQGAIEHANVDAADESVRLMELTRHVESVQRAISIYDKAMDTGINHLGEN
jgi:flagellar basal body rod protein FlgG